MSTLISWIDSGPRDEPPKEVSREEFDTIRERQNELMRRVKIVEAQVRAISAKVDDDDDT